MGSEGVIAIGAKNTQNNVRDDVGKMHNVTKISAKVRNPEVESECRHGEVSQKYSMCPLPFQADKVITIKKKLRSNLQ